MSLLDDDLEVLRGFRSDEAALGPDARARMWARVCGEVPDAPAALDALAPHEPVRALRRRPPRRRVRVLAAAAAVLALAAAAGLALRAGPDEGTVTAGTTAPQPVVPTLEEIAGAVADRPATVLGSTPDARYSHQLVAITIDGPTVEEFRSTEETWTALDGTGRFRETGPQASDEVRDQPGTMPIGPFTPSEAVALPAEPEDVEAAALDASGVSDPVGVSTSVVRTLGYAGLPGQARAGLLRLLGRLGYMTRPPAGDGPNLVGVEGQGPGGSTVRADVDVRTGMVVAWTTTAADGTRDTATVVVADLRPDTRGS